MRRPVVCTTKHRIVVSLAELAQPDVTYNLLETSAEKKLNYLQEYLVDFFGPLPAGTYQLHLHKQLHRCLHEHAFHVETSSNTIDKQHDRIL